jgi:hypothetical protein
VNKGDNAFSVSVNYVADDGNGNNSNAQKGGLMTDNSEASFIAQLGYAGPEWGLAFGYRYGQCDSGAGYKSGTEFAKTDAYNNECEYIKLSKKRADGTVNVVRRTGSGSNSYALNAYWQPDEAGWIPSISLGWGLNDVSSDNKSEGSVTTSQSWFAGLKWDDVFLQGNDMGFAVGQPTFATSVKDCSKASKKAGTCSETPFDGNYVFEWYYNFKVTDNIAITPSVFYLSRPMGQYTNNLVKKGGGGYDGQFNVFGGLVQTTFKF